jgi:hypothetical protein
MQLNLGEWVIIIICSVLILGYILGYLYNRRRAEQIFKWLKPGLSAFGEVSLGEKLPGMVTGGRLEVNQAASPLKRIESVYLLAPRENLLFWLFHMLQGRSDELIVWLTYQSKPEQAVEVARKGNRQLAKRLNDTDKPALVVREGPRRLQVAVQERLGSTTIGKVMAFLERYSNSIVRFALRPDKPHLFLRINLGVMNNISAADLFTTLSNLVS